MFQSLEEKRSFEKWSFLFRVVASCICISSSCIYNFYHEGEHTSDHSRQGGSFLQYYATQEEKIDEIGYFPCVPIILKEEKAGKVTFICQKWTKFCTLKTCC